MVSGLKRACLLFGETYPNGPLSGALMVNNEQVRNKQHSNMQKSRQNSQQSAVGSTGASVDKLSNTNRQLTNLRMAPVLGNIFDDTSNVHIMDENEGNDSDEECYGEEFIKDNDVDELGNNHCLHGYLPDEGYIPESTEEDDDYPKN